MKILLINDTGVKSHIGCQAVSNAHARMIGRLGHTVSSRIFVNELPRQEFERFHDALAAVGRDEKFLAALDGAEAVAVNGEGTIHHGGGLVLIAALELARRAKRPTLLINSLLQDVAVDAEIFNGFDLVSVRDPRSRAYAKWRGIRCVEAFDSVVAADFSNVGGDLRDKIAVTDWGKANDATAGAAASRLLRSDDFGPECARYPMHAEGAVGLWRGAVATIATSRMVVTSRHHGVYLAALAGRPFVALRGSTWKVQGFLDALGGNLPIVESIFDLRAAIERIDQWRPVFEAAQARLREAAELQHFAPLGRGEDSDQAREIMRLGRDIASREELLKIDSKRMGRHRAREARWTETLSGKPKKASAFARWFGDR
jgi:hypothetical protein